MAGGFDGNGNFILRFDWTDDEAAAVVITASRFDQMAVDYQVALENCYTLDSQTTPTTNLAMGSNKITGVTDGTADQDAATISQLILPMGWAASDETSGVSTGNAKLTYQWQVAFTISSIFANVSVAPTGSSMIIDVNDGGSTIMSSAKLEIDAGETTTRTAATPPVLTDTAFAAGAIMTFDFDQVGSTIAGAGVKVYMNGRITT